MKDDLYFIFVFIACVLALILLLFGFGYALVAYTCSNYSEVTSRSTRMSGVNCYIQYEGKWYLSEEFKAVLVMNAKEQK